MSIGEKLSLLRKQRGMTQMELAEELDVSRQAVSRWEQGLSSPSTDNLVSIGKLFDVPVDVLANENIRFPPEVDDQAEETKPEATAPKEADDPPQVIPPKPKRWPLVAVCAGLVCALLLGIAALIGVHTLKQRLEPENAVPAEEMEGEEVDKIPIVSDTLQPLQP